MSGTSPTGSSDDSRTILEGNFSISTVAPSHILDKIAPLLNRCHLCYSEHLLIKKEATDHKNRPSRSLKVRPAFFFLSSLV
jgi:hypothetical protein